MKFIYKIICCPYYEETLSPYEHVDKSKDFNCKCDLPHCIYVLACLPHLFLRKLKVDECFCKKLHGTQICGSCSEKRLVLNFEAKKLCFAKLPDCEESLIGFEQFKTDPLFVFENDLVFCCLENYSYKEIIDNFTSDPKNENGN